MLGGELSVMRGFRTVVLFAALIGLVRAVHAGNDVAWPSYNGNLESDRFSPLAQITLANAADLRKLCELAVGDAGGFQPGLIVVGDRMFVTTAHTVVAMDAANCSVLWRYVYKPDEDEALHPNRGVAYLAGRLFRGTADGRLFALDAATGHELWRTKAANPELGEFLASAPIAWQRLVFIGPGGGDEGIRGRIAAFDAVTGREVWRFNLIPTKGEPGYESWHIPETAEHGGGATWTSYTLDPKTGELFVPVGNPAPDLNAQSRPGENLYTNAVVVLDARSGKLKWYYQFDPNDPFDYDLAATPVLFTNKAGHRRLAVGGKDGYLYILDRDTHKLLSKTAVTTVAKPIDAPEGKGQYICPGLSGGVSWNGPAYSPQTNQVYVGSVDWCMTVRAGVPNYKPPMLYMGTTVDFTGPTSPKTGWVYGVDADTGKALWSYHTDSPALPGVTPTAGGVVLSGEAGGNLLIFDAKTGKVLNKLNLGGPIGSGVITYSTRGKQYVATTTGNISRTGPGSGGNFMPTVVVLAAGLDPTHQPTKVAAASDAELHSWLGKDQGISMFTQYCAACHGMKGSGGEAGPPLVDEAQRKSLAQTIASIKNPTPPMPKLTPPMNDEEVEAVARYVQQLH
jgi:alcohol dehydrogenase (cytochrome c)